METRLPAPAVIVLVGPSASGKSTWASGQFAPEEIVSSDELRGIVGVGRGDQEASEDAFSLLETIVDKRISRGLTTVIDTMGFDQERRRSWIRRAHQSGLGAYVVVFDTSGAECIRRNEERDDPIPKTVLKRQLSRFARVKDEIGEDGFDGVFTEESTVAVVAPQFSTTSKERLPKANGHTFGLIISRFDWPGGPDARAGQIAKVARRAEEAGFRDLWVMDHFRQIHQVGRPWEDMPESYTTLAFLAGITSNIRLGTLVTGVTYRNPAHLGKIVATLDVLSGGRAICGVGLGWDEEEHEGYGWEFPPTNIRYELLEDTLELLPLIWGKGTPEFEGRLIEAKSLACYPRPIQDRIPILVGGSGEKRTLRLVARYADACNLFGDPDRVAHKVAVLHGHCDDVGRDPEDIEVTHLTNVVVDADRPGLRNKVERLKSRSQSHDAYALANNAGTVDDLTGLFRRYSAAGADHSVISMPDVVEPRSLETFSEVIANFRGS